MEKEGNVQAFIAAKERPCTKEEIIEHIGSIDSQQLEALVTSGKLYVPPPQSISTAVK